MASPKRGPYLADIKDSPFGLCTLETGSGCETSPLRIYVQPINTARRSSTDRSALADLDVPPATTLRAPSDVLFEPEAVAPLPPEQGPFATCGAIPLRSSSPIAATPYGRIPFIPFEEFSMHDHEFVDGSAHTFTVERMMWTPSATFLQQHRHHWMLCASSTTSSTSTLPPLEGEATTPMSASFAIWVCMRSDHTGEFSDQFQSNYIRLLEKQCDLEHTSRFYGFSKAKGKPRVVLEGSACTLRTLMHKHRGSLDQIASNISTPSSASHTTNSPSSIESPNDANSNFPDIPMMQKRHVQSVVQILLQTARGLQEFHEVLGLRHLALCPERIVLIRTTTDGSSIPTTRTNDETLMTLKLSDFTVKLVGVGDSCSIHAGCQCKACITEEEETNWTANIDRGAQHTATQLRPYCAPEASGFYKEEDLLSFHCTSHQLLSPNEALNLTRRSLESDIYSFGVIAVELLTMSTEPQWQGETFDRRLKALPDFTPCWLANLIQRCSLLPHQRPMARELVECLSQSQRPPADTCAIGPMRHICYSPSEGSVPLLLRIAAELNDIQLLEDLFVHKKVVTEERFNACRDKDGNSFFHIAARFGSFSVIKDCYDYLSGLTAQGEMEKFCEINIRHPITGATPLMLAAGQSHAFAVEILLELAEHTNNTRCMLDIRDEMGNTALHYAAQRFCPKTFCLLVEWKANTDVRNSAKQTPIEVQRSPKLRQQLQTYMAKPQAVAQKSTRTEPSLEDDLLVPHRRRKEIEAQQGQDLKSILSLVTELSQRRGSFMRSSGSRGTPATAGVMNDSNSVPGTVVQFDVARPGSVVTDRARDDDDSEVLERTMTNKTMDARIDSVGGDHTQEFLIDPPHTTHPPQTTSTVAPSLSVLEGNPTSTASVVETLKQILQQQTTFEDEVRDQFVYLHECVAAQSRQMLDMCNGAVASAVAREMQHQPSPTVDVTHPNEPPRHSTSSTELRATTRNRTKAQAKGHFFRTRRRREVVVPSTPPAWTLSPVLATTERFRDDDGKLRPLRLVKKIVKPKRGPDTPPNSSNSSGNAQRVLLHDTYRATTSTPASTTTRSSAKMQEDPNVMFDA